MNPINVIVYSNRRRRITIVFDNDKGYNVNIDSALSKLFFTIRTGWNAVKILQQIKYPIFNCESQKVIISGY